jgi:hypothetical protein
MVAVATGRRRAASMAAVTTGRVESDENLESGGDLESFWMNSKMTRGGLLFIGSEISAAVLA